jgi:TatD DNase family protein
MIDSHCHLAGEEFAADLPDVVGRAKIAGVSQSLVILSAGDERENARAGDVKTVWPEARFSVGIHPHHAGDHEDIDRGIAILEDALDAHAAVAVGEIGLDYHYDFSPREVQQAVFRRQIRLARERQLPIVIHTREATDDTFRILREEAAGLRIVFHCFTGGSGMASAALALGAHLSFAGIVTFPKAAELRDVAKSAPLDRVLVETDSPYLAPVPHRGKRNEPAFVARVVEAIAGLHGLSASEVADRTTANFRAVFGV